MNKKNKKPFHIYILKTLYPHWGEHTAFNSFLKYFDRQRFRLTLRDVPMGDDRFRFPSFLKNYCRKKIAKKKVSQYRLNDLAAEISLFVQTFFKKIHVVHFIDAEHSLMFFPYWNKRFQFCRSVPKIVAMFHQPPAILEKLIDIEIVRRVDHVLVVSPVQADYFAQFLPRERISTILLGVEADHFKPAPGKKQPATSFKCLAGGKWLRDYDAIYKTAALLRKTPEIEFHIVAARGENAPVGGNIFYHENIPDAQLLELYQTGSVLFLPFTDATANTFLLEGCACGLPVISSDLPSLRAYFPGEEAILIKNNDPTSFAVTLIGLSCNPKKLARMAGLARKRALELSWPQICKEYETLYEQVQKELT